MNQQADKQSLGVILAIIGSGIVIAIVAIVLFYALKGKQKIVATNAATTIQMEETVGETEGRE